jgi:hypothetical protein
MMCCDDGWSRISPLFRNNNTKAYQIPSCRTEIRKESYFPRTIRDWNALPDNCVTIGSLETFKALITERASVKTNTNFGNEFRKVYMYHLLLLPECDHHQFVAYSATFLDAHAKKMNYPLSLNF